MHLADIEKAEFDEQTMVLTFDARVMLGKCSTTIVSSIRLKRRPEGAVAVRWAIMERALNLLAA